MKTALLTAAVSLIALAPAAASPESSDTTFEGYVRFVGEEFQLIERQNQYVSGRQRPCVSGALPRDLQRLAATDIAGQKVRITGTVMAWSADLPGDRYAWEGSNIRNECGADHVILATDIAAIP
jgi:hypothetical protein